MENKKVLTHPHMREIPYIYMGHLIYVFCWRLKIILTDETVIDRIYTKALADRILSSVQRLKNLRVKPGFPVRIFYLFKMSSKKLISRIYIYIYTKSLIFWAYKLWKYISELFYLLDPCIYIYGFLHFQWYILFDEEWISTKSTISYQYIHQRRNHHWYHWSVGIFYLLVSCIYIYIGFLHPPWITDYCIQQRMNF